MVDVDVPQSQTDSWASTNWNRSDGTQFTTFTFDYLEKSVSSSNQESSPNCHLATCELPHAWTSFRQRFHFRGKTILDDVLGPKTLNSLSLTN